MLNIAICDDNLKVCSKIEKYIKKIVDQKNLKVNIDIFYTKNNFIDKFENNKELYDIIFLDIHIEKSSGIEIGKYIRDFNLHSKIIYISFDKSKALDLFETNPFDFLIKPIKSNKFTKLFNKLLKTIYQSKEFFKFKIRRKVYKIPISKILYFENDKRKVNLYLKDKNYSFYEKLDNIAKKLKKDKFIRTHQSYLVNENYIKKYETNKLILSNNQIIPISQKYKEILKERFLCF